MDRIGRYKIVRELGRGAMGVVYHAIDPNIGRPVAIKTIVLNASRKPEEQERMRERLFREARSAGILSHPGIVTIYDVEQQGDLAYIAMEYVDGPTLDQILSAEHAVTPEKMFSILTQTAAALDYAHGKGIVHRDIKPANIMLTADGTAKITDFGIAKITASEQFTMTGSIVGTPHYMSPEQVQGLPVDGRSDQFSLAVIAFEMLTGEKPYTGEHLTTVVYKIVAEEPLPPHRLNPSLGGVIAGVIQKALAKKPEGRYRNCQEFVTTLERACASTRGWKLLPRSGGLNAPTLAESAKPAVSLPPARKPVRTPRAGETATTGIIGERKSSFLTFLLAMLVATGLLALIGWQALPWLNPAQPAGKAMPPKTAIPVAKSEPPPSTQPSTPPSTPPDTAPAPSPTASKPAEEKPSPMPSAGAGSEKSGETPQSKAASPGEAPRPPVGPPRRAAASERPAPEPQPFTIISSPGGAKAVFDRNPETACTTPCTAKLLPGRHTIAVSLSGFMEEHRDIDVGPFAMEMPVVLHAVSGSLMLTTDPPGASVLVDGRATNQVTPAELRLPPGSYKITVEKDGRPVTQVVEIRNGITTLKITLPR